MVGVMRSPSPDSSHVAPLDDAGAPARDDDSERELRALLRLSAVVAGAHALEDVLDVAAQETLEALGSSTVSISRWDRPNGTLRTLVNVGDLAPDEQHRPEAELYPLAQFPRAFELLSRGQAHITLADDPDADPMERRMLADLGKHSCLAVPIVHEGETWGELYAALGATSAHRFGDRDVRFMSAVSSQVASAIARAEVFTQIARFAFEDPLTGLANRRALDERLAVAMERAERDGGDVTLVLSDLDGLKQTNDALGHGAGDARLTATAAALRGVAALWPAALPARIGGDEFCLLLEGMGIGDGQRAAGQLRDRLAATSTAVAMPMTVSSGVAAMRLGPRRPADLFRLADAAQYQAKRSGPGRVCVAGREPGAVEPEQRGRRSRREANRGPLEALLVDGLARLDDGLAGASTLDRVAAVTDACARAAGATSWVISRLRADGLALETVLSAQPDLQGGAASRRFRFEGDVYVLADYPDMARVLRDGGVQLAALDDPGTAPPVRALMIAHGYENLLAVSVTTPKSMVLVELFAGVTAVPFARLAPYLRALLAQAAQPL